MSAAVVAVALSLLSAVAYAGAAVAQERLAARSPGTGLLRLLGSGAWWASTGLNGGAALLHVVALKYGPLTVVQPLGALTLVAAVPLGARVAGRRVGTAEWRGTALTLLGLAAILAAASGPAPEDVLGVGEALAVAGSTAALIGLLARPGTRPGLRHATASGCASGVASALTQTVTVAATDRSGPLLSVQVLGVALLVAAFATAGLLLSQTAYRGGLGAPLAVVTLANPVAAAVIGIALLGERLRGGATGMLPALLGAGLAGWGVVLLSRTAPEPKPADGAEHTAAAVTREPEPADGAEHPVAAVAVPEPAPVGGEEHPVAAAPAPEPTLVGRAEHPVVALLTPEPEPAPGPAGRAERPVAAVAVPEPAPVGGEGHPVAVVLVLEPRTASPEPVLLPRQPGGPGRPAPLQESAAGPGGGAAGAVSRTRASPA